MADDNATARFIRSAFSSIWSLELLLILREQPDHWWTQGELISALRASEAVLARSTSDLGTAGLIASADGRLRYSPTSSLLGRTVDKVARLYAVRPQSVRRLIVGQDQEALISFANAFRIRKE